MLAQGFDGAVRLSAVKKDNAMKPTRLMIGLAIIASIGTAATAQADEYCREYQRKVTIGGQIVDSWGTACMQPDGSWKLDSGDVVSRIAEPVYYTQPAPVAVVEPLYVQQQIVYHEPIYSTYRYYSGPSWGVSLNWSDRDGWKRHDRPSAHKDRGHHERGHMREQRRHDGGKHRHEDRPRR
jgi:hypothetical protein